MSDPTGSDRRRHPRAPIELKVEYKRLNSFFADYTRNISRGGTFIRTKRPLDVGTEFVFRLVVPRLEKPLELHGRVQWVVTAEDADDEREPGMGIGFIYDSEADRERIAGIVERLMVDSLGNVLYEKLLGKGQRGGDDDAAAAAARLARRPSAPRPRATPTPTAQTSATVVARATARTATIRRRDTRLARH